MDDLTSANVFGNIALGASRALDPRVQADKADARALKQQREEELKFAKATQNTRQSIKTDELEILRAQNQQMLADSAKRRAFDGFDRYTGDGDTRHLNVMLQDLKSNPAGAKLFGDWVRVDKVSEQDKGLFIKEGLDPDLFLSNPQTQRSIIKGTNANGDTKLIDVDALFRSTGYSKYISDQERKRQLEVAQIYKAYRTTGAKTERERHIASVLESEGLEVGTPEYETRRQQLYTEMTAKSSTTNRLTADEREAQRRARLAGATDENFDAVMQEELEKIKERNRQTAGSKDMDEVEESKANLDNLAGGDFSSIDIDELSPSQYSKVESEIQRIERLGKLKFDAADKKQLAAIRDLIMLGREGTELSPEKVGWFDDIVGSVKKYISDDVKGIDATSAYTTYVNSLANALYGSALSAAEIERLNRQFGTLKQQTGPVLQQFRTGLLQLRSQLSNLASNTDSYVTHFRLGRNQEELNNIINRIDERIEFISGYENKTEQPTGSNKTTTTKKTDENLLNILKGGNNEN